MTWLVDDGPLGLLARTWGPSWSWPESAITVVREVADGAASDKSGRRTKLLAMCAPSSLPSVAVHDCGYEAAAVLYGHLRPIASQATRDLGEDASIAAALTEVRDAVFVTMDKRAAYIALAELGSGRVATPFDLWDHLERAGLVSLAEYRALADLTTKQDHGLADVPLRHKR
ncbi:MAG TPA: hypothetical protein PK141_24765 [Polyangiaceae bacterium]|nr:hypothetical protein [Polyangiaceae bacterium]